MGYLESQRLQLKGRTLTFPRMHWVSPLYPSLSASHPGTTASPSSISLARNIRRCGAIFSCHCEVQSVLAAQLAGSRAALRPERKV